MGPTEDNDGPTEENEGAEEQEDFFPSPKWSINKHIHMVTNLLKIGVHLKSN